MPSYSVHHRAMSAGEPDCARFGVQSVVERADGPDATAGSVLRFEHDDIAPRRAKDFGGAQPGKAGADDDDRIVGSGSCSAAERDRSDRSGPCRLLQKAPAVHGSPNAMMFEPAAIATYCLLSKTYVIGDAFQSALV
jgi:hypothetical protein